MVQVPAMNKVTEETLQPQDNVVIKQVFVDRIPSNWTIEAAEDDLIYATSGKTQERFKGNIEEFNAMLRG